MPAKKKNNPPPSPNEEQLEAINFEQGYACLLAGPGSGKSFVLTQRLARLIREGVDPSDTISLSFTKTAARNLRDKVEDQVGKFETIRPAGALTFHSLALKFAESERHEFNFELAEAPLCPEPAANKHSGDAARRFEVNPRDLRSIVSLWKRKRLRPAQVIKDCEDKLDAKRLKLALAYKDYQKRLTGSGTLDFDSLIFEMVEILDKKPAVRKRWTRDYLQVDEAQDLSKIEWDLVKLVSGKSVLAVGDISQGIYGFRGSDSKLFQKMDEIFPGTRTLYLACNYRSTPEIIDFIRPIASSQDLAEKFHTPNQSGPAPEIKGFKTPGEEVAYVIKRIKESL